ncbi:MAG: peroxiredoxin [Candidatus Melainabacteria bacterium GWF2_37_15]|nr:MAG: peroxiredoxin [Candidatus Melainabacteria bacterium GWF2_37_15]
MTQNYQDYQDYEEVIEVCACPRLHEPAPDFEADTNQGHIKFSEYNKGSWVILFSHPADFTPVCTTEFIGFAQKQEEFEKRNVKLLGLSIDSVYSHIAWIKQIEEDFETEIKFPVIADLGMEVAHLYNMIHPAVSDVHAIRSIYIIDPKGILRGYQVFPMSVGRNVDEIIRMIDAMQIVDEKQVATPANWKPGENVIIPPPKTQEEARKRVHEKHAECKSWFLCKTGV